MKGRNGMSAALVLAGFIGVAPFAADVLAQRVVRIIIPAAPGGASDTLARSMAPKLTEMWGAQVIVENRAGAGGIVGTEFVAKAPADGNTLLGGNIGPLAIAPHLAKRMPYDALKDFE